jgi:hypothetical protein
MSKTLVALTALSLLAGCTRFDEYLLREGKDTGVSVDGLYVHAGVDGKETLTKVIPLLYDRREWREPFTLHYYAGGQFEDVLAFKATAILDGRHRIELPIDRRRVHLLTHANGEPSFHIEATLLPFKWSDFDDFVLETEFTLLQKGVPHPFKLRHRFAKDHTWTLGPYWFFAMMSV